VKLMLIVILAGLTGLCLGRHRSRIEILEAAVELLEAQELQLITRVAALERKPEDPQ